MLAKRRYCEVLRLFRPHVRVAAGARISGSTPAGGHNTPSDFASLSPSGSLRWPVVVPSGAMVPCCGTDWVGAQALSRAGAGAVWACGVTGAGGACALTAPHAASSTPDKRIL